MTKTWKIGYRFNPKTGEKRPWEIVNQVFVDGKRVSVVQWASCKTEEGAIKSIAAGRKRSEEWENTKLYAEQNITREYIGKMA